MIAADDAVPDFEYSESPCRVGSVHMRMRITFLPAKASPHPFLSINEIRRVGFDIANQVSQRHCGFQSNQNMDVIRHAIVGYDLLFLVSNNASHVLVEFYLYLCPCSR